MKNRFDQIMKRITVQNEIYGIAVLLGPPDKFVSDNLEQVQTDVDMETVFDYDEKYEDTLNMLDPKDLKLFKEQVKTFVYRVKTSKDEERVTVCIHLTDQELIEKIVRLFSLSEVTFYIMKWIDKLKDYNICHTLKSSKTIELIENSNTVDSNSSESGDVLYDDALVRSKFIVIGARVAMNVILVDDVKWLYEVSLSKDNNDKRYAETVKRFNFVILYLKNIDWFGIKKELIEELESELASSIITYFEMDGNKD